MQFIIESMETPVDNFAGMLLYAVLYMSVAALVVGLAVRFIPNPLPYVLKSAIVGTAVFISLILWWVTIIN